MRAKNASLSRNIEKLYRSDMGTDVEFIFPNQSGFAKSVRAHKVVLAASSPVFQRMFYGELKEGDTVEIVDTTFEAFCEFLQFVYKEDIDLTEKYMFEVFRAVDKYDPQGGHQVCENILRETVTTELICLYYELAMTFNFSAELIEHLEKIICEDAYNIFETDSFKTCNQTILKHILKMDHLVCTELDILKAAKSWAKEVCESKALQVSPENIKAELGNCFALIRFPIMTADQLTRCCEIYPNFLDNNEFCDILQYIMNKREMTTAKHFSIVPRGCTDINAIFYTGIALTDLNDYHNTSSLNVRIGEGCNVLLTYYEIMVPEYVTSSISITYLNGKEMKIHSLEDYEENEEKFYKIYRVSLRNPILIRPNERYDFRFVIDTSVKSRFKMQNIQNERIAGVPFTISGDNYFIKMIGFERLPRNKNGFIMRAFYKYAGIWKYLFHASIFYGLWHFSRFMG